MNKDNELYKARQIRHSMLMQAQTDRIAIALYELILSRYDEFLVAASKSKTSVKMGLASSKIVDELFKDAEKLLLTSNFDLAKYDVAFQAKLSKKLSGDYFEDKRTIKGVSKDLLKKLNEGAAFQGALISEFLEKEKINLNFEIKRQFTAGIQAGESIDAIGRRLKNNALNTSARNAVILSRTATTNVLNQANDAFYQENKIEYYQFVSILDKRTTDICRKNNGKIFRVDDKSAPRPPLHYQCRSTTIPIFNKDQAISGSFKDFAEKQKRSNILVDDNGNYKQKRSDLMDLDDLKKKEEGILDNLVV